MGHVSSSRLRKIFTTAFNLLCLLLSPKIFQIFLSRHHLLSAYTSSPFASPVHYHRFCYPTSISHRSLELARAIKKHGFFIVDYNVPKKMKVMEPICLMDMDSLIQKVPDVRMIGGTRSALHGEDTWSRLRKIQF